MIINTMNKLIPKKQTAGNIEYVPHSKTGELYYAKDRYGKPVLDSASNLYYDDNIKIDTGSNRSSYDPYELEENK